MTVQNATPTAPGDGDSDPDAPAVVLTVSADQVARGGQVTVHGTGLAASTRYRLVLHSAPVLLATVTSAADGTIDQTVTIPADTTLGEHTLQVSAADASDTVLASVTLTITPGDLAATGGSSGALGQAVLAGVLLLLAGLGAAALGRRRRRAF